MPAASGIAGRDIAGLPPRADLAPRRRPHLPDHRDLRLDDACARTCRSRCSRTPASSAVVLGLRRPPASRARPTRCSRSSASATQAERACGELAYGDLKRLELAIALANAPKLLLMDEPTAGMAPQERVELMRARGRASRASAGIGVLFTEHDMDVVFDHADRVMVLDRGRIIASGPPDAVRDDPAGARRLSRRGPDLRGSGEEPRRDARGRRARTAGTAAPSAVRRRLRGRGRRGRGAARAATAPASRRR